ncbi:MAG: DUF5615 family PIN-like protein [Bacteroidota bacterium]
MKLLLDENLPVRLKYRFNKSIPLSTVSDEGWSSTKNGELLKLMRGNGFTVLVTADRNLRYQQNLAKYEIVIILLISRTNRYQDLISYIPDIEATLPPNISHGVIEIKSK